MSAPNNQPITKQQHDRFKAYYKTNKGWLWLSLVLDKRNIHDSHVLACQRHAAQHGDQEAYELCDILLTMSKSQRVKLGKEQF